MFQAIPTKVCGSLFSGQSQLQQSWATTVSTPMASNAVGIIGARLGMALMPTVVEPTSPPRQRLIAEASISLALDNSSTDSNFTHVAAIPSPQPTSGIQPPSSSTPQFFNLMPPAKGSEAAPLP
ncbi:hypothetical protein M9H77_08798 [Catharanthus roseus]|uniref:Uncharacterized protein n=1 Tax=Catharanthus roseus TaxID=4058 RepID=A0ACC0BZ86_CATRO|nr:hypothetical protein M9H77_08798 [Catharanthus roseus]